MSGKRNAIYIYAFNDDSLFVVTTSETGEIDHDKWLAASYYVDRDRKKCFYDYPEFKEYICKYFDWE